MLKPVEKTKPALIHHPSTVLDDLCVFGLANESWVSFDEKINEQLREFEERNRAYFTPQAVRRSLDRN
jgi:hypothetical protein